MPPQPPYEAVELRPAYHLRYAWTAWPSQGRFPCTPLDGLLEILRPLWERDGLRPLETTCTGDVLKICFSAAPHLSPVLLAARAKGRWQHACRVAGLPGWEFSRKLAVRSVGDNKTDQVEAYLRGQVDRSLYADERFRELLSEFTIVDPQVDLSLPTETSSGRYWYNLHVVLVTAAGHLFTDRARLGTIRDGCFRIAANKGHQIAALSVMPDHVHMALRGNIEHSPQEIALAYVNNLAWLLDLGKVWDGHYYAGTFSEYDMHAIRHRVRDR